MLLQIHANQKMIENFGGVYQDLAYEKQGRATIKFRGYRRLKRRTPPTK